MLENYFMSRPINIDPNEGIDKDFDALVQPWKLPKPQKYAFINGVIIDTDKGVAVKKKTVLTANGRFEDIISSSKEFSSDYKVIDCEGKFLCPGLFDNHVHVVSAPGETELRRLFDVKRDTVNMRAAKNIEMMLARGFTSIRDTGGAGYHFVKAIEEGVIKGPRLFFCGGAISQTGGHGDFRDRETASDEVDSCACHRSYLGVVADGVPECMRAARDNLRTGAHFIKIMGGGGVASPTDKLTNMQYTDEEIQAIVKVAQSYDTFVTAHAYTPRSIQTCIKNGVKGIEHGNLIDDETAKLIVKNGVYVTPTLITYKVMSSDQFSKFLTPDSLEKNKVILQSGLACLAMAKKYRIKLCFGSDLLGSLTGYQTLEFSLRAKVLEAAEILRSATITPAECLGVSDVIGQIKKGYYADLLILENNPLENIVSMDKFETNLLMVMKDGVIMKSKLDSISKDVSEPEI
ncbi:hypothetical protein OGAPHI_001343 [Ogataea philodendri]|uniref:Amidohydrolase-related domain-containing protein n=1 Tax=Ogataea philodendri TaxID=1378263 RepID=A0A9P8PDC9_9ASCO|nr:uncharacterized protein OGAPHI_001343 [Ogataea philodendri]KAH3669222.1 hypothetical protein OGAPHI_001343 [Ogataea philodendri]